MSFSGLASGSSRRKNETCAPHKSLRIKKVNKYRAKLAQGLRRDTILHHSYLVLEIEDGTYWTIEKNNEGVVIQQDINEDTAINYLYTEKRKSPIFDEESCESSRTTTEFYKWLVSNKELVKGYLVLVDDCQVFARRVYSYLKN